MCNAHLKDGHGHRWTYFHSLVKYTLCNYHRPFPFIPYPKPMKKFYFSIHDRNTKYCITFYYAWCTMHSNNNVHYGPNKRNYKRHLIKSYYCVQWTNGLFVLQICYVYYFIVYVQCRMFSAFNTIYGIQITHNK